MANYQLYRTNTKLGGQLQWDIILGDYNGKLCVDDLHLAPISSNIPFNRFVKSNILKYNHLDNIRDFYKQTSGYFYNDGLDKSIQGPWPIFSNIEDSENKKQYYYSELEMGCKRVSYKIYQKQFKIFCPVWLEDIDSDEDKLQFVFEFYVPKSGGGRWNYYTKELTFDTIDSGSKNHTLFSKYFKNHIRRIGINKKNPTHDDLMYVSFDKKVARISGINVETGNLQTSSINSLVENLTNRERPLMEFDNMILENFQNHKIISKQLFNFCFYFNIEDIIDPSFFEQLDIITPSINIRVQKICKDGTIEKFELKDIYSNYEFIPKTICKPYQYTLTIGDDGVINIENIGDENESLKGNVLDYLKDYQCVNLMDKNKLSQNIFHWALTNDSNYIFNLYQGFSAEYIDTDKKKYQLSHVYCDSPDIYQSKVVNENSTSLNWCNKILCNINENSNIRTLLPELFNYDHYFSSLNKSVKYIQYSNYSQKILWLTADSSFDWENAFESKYLIRHDIQIENDNITIATFNYEEYKDKYIILSDSTKDNKITFRKFLNTIRQVPELKQLYDALHSYIDPSIIVIPNSLKYSIADGPMNVTEIEYYKTTESSDYLIRYSGKLKPFFIDKNSDLGYSNKRYYKKDSYIEDLKTFNKHKSSKFLPLYPSIGYYYIQSEQEIYYDDNIKYDECYRFDQNKLYMLTPSLYFEIISTDESIIDDTVKEYIKNYYKNYENHDYIKSLYEYTIDYEYSQINDYKDVEEYIKSFPQYKYRIKLELK